MFLIHQVIKFMIVGTLAATCHIFVMAVSVEKLLFPPLMANIIAFLIAFVISFAGHKKWTFKGCTHYNTLSIKFFTVAFCTLLLSEFIIYLLYNVWHYHYILATIAALIIVPPVTFALSKLWVFNHN